MSDRWSREQVLALAPDAVSQRAAERAADPGRWSGTGCSADEDGAAVWGACKGSGAKPYRACVDLSGPAYRCTCPSRKFPCKHALALLLLWSAGGVPAAPAAADWVLEWIDERRERGARAARGVAGPRGAEPADPQAQRRRADQREHRVAAGVEELDRWLQDQVRGGLAEAHLAGYGHWETAAARLVDAQASAPAAVLRRLAAVPRSGEGWPGRLLEEYAMLRLLVVAARRLPELPDPLRQVVRSRLGFTVDREEVLAGPTVRDRWHVVGQHDSEEDRLAVRRVWLQGRDRAALVLSFAGPGQPLDASLVVGTAVDAELAFYPGTLALRALVARRHGGATAAVPRGGSVAALLGAYAGALACDPWLEAWPAVLEGVRPARDGGWALVDPDGDAVPLHPGAGEPWRLVALSGGRPLTVAGEWSPRGLLWLTAWDTDGRVVAL
ncbi:MAG TPA: SWIM zinc finger family protein [Actinomycetota bacterium]|jgi:SWIM zinc finger